MAKAPDGQWIYLFRPEMIQAATENSAGLVRPGLFRSEKLVNMAKHDYKLEPNVSFTPDRKMIVFRSNMLGDTYVFGVKLE